MGTAGQITAEQATLPTTGKWNFDTTHSAVRFSIVNHAVAWFRAGFQPVVGAFDGDTQVLAGEVQVNDVQVGMDILHGHLQRADFFDAENHPAISFRSTRLEGVGGRLLLEGDLTIKGVTRSIFTIGSFTAPELVAHYDGTEVRHFGIELGVTIDRRDYDLSFNNSLPSGVTNLGWEVAIEVSLELIEAASS
jgi:polyisoprenoid-binding protein YceI